jgi:hypothetical protein
LLYTKGLSLRANVCHRKIRHLVGVVGIRHTVSI